MNWALIFKNMPFEARQIKKSENPIDAKLAKNCESHFFIVVDFG